jgi:hypothetical protein
VKKASKWTSILHALPNFPSKPLFLEALQIPLQTQASPFFFLFLFPFAPYPISQRHISCCHLPAHLPEVACRPPPPPPGVRRGSGRAGGLIWGAAPPMDACTTVLASDVADLLLELEDLAAAR